MLQIRLSRALESHFQPQQYGFRQGRSISSPLFLLRRLIEICERRSASLYILLLDGSQAFDSITHTALKAELLRYGVPPHCTAAIMSFYHSGQFFVSDQNTDSPIYSLQRGIRQGCPLSPYLFIVVLSALTTDLHTTFEALFSYTPWTYSPNHSFTDIEYADDTALMSRTHETLHRLLHLLQYLAARIGLLLNGSKCQLLAIHTTQPISLSNSVTPDQPCSCPFCAHACALIPDPSVLALLLTPQILRLLSHSHELFHP